ncbi:RNA recognition motif domain [Macleaya cordata]|uniref:RNA recognition motif domain n=1 Tax=Macleaya cordata TaxID=56857 RepID=A0A200R9D6_MACCD|nr:RNA recognition motif domain [Macleaya cordata]
MISVKPIEYIVVLVCNGKHQHQARDDLEAFLGERSREFVSWLWGILSKIVHQSHVPNDSSNLKDVIVRSACDDDVDNEQRSCRLKDLQNDGIGNADNLLSHGEKFHLLTSSPRRVSPIGGVYEGCQHREPEFDPSVGDINTKGLCTQLHKREISRKSGSAEVSHHETLKHDSSRVKGSSGNSSGDEQSMQYMQHKKIVNNNRNELLHQLQHPSMREVVSRNSQPVMTENPHPRLHSVTKVAGRRLPLRVADPVSKQNARPRGSVWDRLGRQCEDNKIGRSKEIEVGGIDVTRKIAAHNGWCSRSMGEVPLVDNSCGIFIPETNHDDHRQHEQGLHTTCSPNDANNCGRKRQFGEIDPGVANMSVSLVHGNYRHVQVKETFEESERSTSVICSRSKRLNSVVSEIRKSYDAAIYHAFKSPVVPLNTRANSVSQTKLTRMASETTPNRTLDSANSALVANSGSNNEEGVNTSVKPVESEVSDVKLRFHQIETKMSKLHSKQVEMTNDGQINSSSSTGTSNHPEKDSELRTVFVTNVHFAATKEALSLHFAKCGVVVKVIILIDTVTGLPKGSAYITFASKESVEKAVALSGSSFWSRTLKVLRKAEMPVATPSPVQLTGKPSQSWFLQQPNRNLTLQRPYSSSNLQWRRDQPLNADHSVSNSTQGGRLEASESVMEQKRVDSGTGQMHIRSLTYVRTTQTQAGQAAAGSMETSTAA